MIIRMDTEIYKDDQTYEVTVRGEFDHGDLINVYLEDHPPEILAIPFEQLYSIEEKLCREYEDSYQGE